MAIKPERKIQQHSVEGTIGGASSNINISFGTVTIAHDIQITNDDSTNSISAKVNSTGNAAITIKAGETQTLNNGNFTALYLTNSSGSTVSFRVAMLGE